MLYFYYQWGLDYIVLINQLHSWFFRGFKFMNNDLESISSVYDSYVDLCSDLNREIEFKKSKIVELDTEIEKRLEIINQVEEINC